MVSPTNINIADETVEYFVYNERGIQGSKLIQVLRLHLIQLHIVHQE